MTQTVRLAGATGMLGSQIARHLLNQPEAHLRLLVRGGDAGKRAALSPLLARGAEIIEGTSLTAPPSTTRRKAWT